MQYFYLAFLQSGTGTSSKMFEFSFHHLFLEYCCYTYLALLFPIYLGQEQAASILVHIKSCMTKSKGRLYLYLKKTCHHKDSLRLSHISLQYTVDPQVGDGVLGVFRMMFDYLNGV